MRLSKLLQLPALIATLALTACPAPKDGNNNPPNYYPPGQCYGTHCNGGYYPPTGQPGQNISVATGYTNPQANYGADIRVELQLISNQGQALPPGQLAQMTGSISAGGFMYVNSAPNCNLAPGQYMIQTVQPGQVYYGMIVGLKVIAQGPGQAEVQFGLSQVHPIFLSMRNDGSVSLMGDMRIERVNGQYCQNWGMVYSGNLLLN